MKKTEKALPTASFSGYFPAEILTEVLAGVPAKSLLRFRCVSKTWRDLIDNPNFISMHFNHYNQNHKNHQKCAHILTLQWTGRHGISFTICSSDTLRRSAPLIKFSETHLLPRASFNGLVLFTQFHWDDPLLLWNPSIRKSLQIPSCPIASCYDVYAVGFSALMKDYKVVNFQFKPSKRNSSGPVFAVYGVRDGCWRRSTRLIDVLDWEHSFVRSECLSIKGSAYWLMCSVTRDLVVSFDFNTEEISILELPDYSSGEEMLWFLFLLGESVALLSVSPVSICIWVMKKDGGNEPWTKWYSGDISLDEYGLFENHTPRKVLFVEKSSVFLMIFHWKVMWYNIRSHEMREVAKFIPVADMYIYEDSLLLCGGLEGQTLSSLP